MPVTTRSAAFDQSPVTPVTDKDEMCPICMTGLGNDRIKTFCGHSFHAQCIVDSLQYKRECPLCRHVPIPPGKTTEEVEHDDLYDTPVIDSVMDIVVNRLDRFCPDDLVYMLSKYKIDRTIGWSKVDKVNALAEQLLYETDSEQEEDDDNINEDDLIEEE